MEKLTSLKDVYASGPAATTSPTKDTHIYCFGRFEQNIPNYSKVKPSSNLYVIDIVRKQTIQKVSPDVLQLHATLLLSSTSSLWLFLVELISQ